MQTVLMLILSYTERFLVLLQIVYQFTELMRFLKNQGAPMSTIQAQAASVLPLRKGALCGMKKAPVFCGGIFLFQCSLYHSQDLKK